jgi:hypothetical protein
MPVFCAPPVHLNCQRSLTVLHTERRCSLAWVAAVAGLSLAATGVVGCKGSSDTTAPDDQLAEVAFALDLVPPGVKCFSVLVATTESKRYNVPVTGVPRFTINGLPAVVAVLTVEAVDEPCDAVVAGKSVVSWSAGPVTAKLKPGRNELTITFRAVAQATLSLGFDPNAVRTCAAAGSACVRNSDCCSLSCAAAGSPFASAGQCLAEEPPTPPGVRLEQDIALLRELQAGASFPTRDGDFFFVSFPKRGNPDASDGSAAAVRTNYVQPALRATGVTTAAMAGVSTPRQPEAQALPGGNFRALTDTICANEGREGQGQQICSFLRGIMTPNQDIPALVVDTLGMSPGQLAAEINGRLLFWFFSQQEPASGVPIEHKGAIAVRYEDTKVSGVFGAVLNNHRVVNAVGLAPQAAVDRARPALIRLEKLIDRAPGPPPEAELVLLPYGADTPGRTALRFAWRVKITAARQVLGGTRPVTYLAWVDAENGDLLKKAALQAEATTTIEPWCRNPADVNPLCLVTVNNLQTAGALMTSDAFEVSSPGLEPAVISPRANETCLVSSAFRRSNTMAHLERAQQLLQNGGKFIDFLPRKVSVAIDDAGDQNAANFDNLTINLVKGATGTSDCSDTDNTLLAGAQDASIITHEFAHLATMQLQNTAAQKLCGQPTCPTLNPYGRIYFHDYSDGYAAMMSDSPCIGGWAAKNKAGLGTSTTTGAVGAAGHGPADLAKACGRADESSLLPRMLFADPNPNSAFVEPANFSSSAGFLPDTFPTHRNAIGGAGGEYADGQILGAALWHLWHGMRSMAPVAGTSPVWGRVNQGVFATGFSINQCSFDVGVCDSNIYRSGRELLLQLTHSWINSNADGAQSTHKLLSAFARTGIFLTPASCLDGDPGTRDATVDLQFCPFENLGADAIVDIDDADDRPADARDINGVKFADNDFVHRVNGPVPRFRVWTGVPFRFGKDPTQPGKADEERGWCNRNFRVEFRLANSGAAPKTVSGTTTTCYAEVEANPDDGTSWSMFANSTTGRAKIEYRVKTWNGSGVEGADPTLRDSAKPGAGMWPTTTAAAVFYVNSLGVP